MAASHNQESSFSNRSTWSKNLDPFQHITNSRKIVTQNSLAQLTRMPTEEQVLNRFKFLAAEIKGRNSRRNKVVEELQSLWIRLSFPSLSLASMFKKIDSLLQKSNKQRRKSTKTTDFSNVFDITNSNGAWLCNEDRIFYEAQKFSKGTVGYCTNVSGDNQIHPSKKRKTCKTNDSPANIDFCHTISDDETDNVEEDTNSSSDSGRKQYSSATLGVKLLRRHSLSSNKTSNILDTLSNEGICIPNPTQSGIWRATMKAANKLKEV